MGRIRSALCQVTILALAAVGSFVGGRSVEAVVALKLPDDAPTVRFDFEGKTLDGWQTVSSRWAIEDMAGPPRGKPVLVQRAVDNPFNVIVAPGGGPYTDVDVLVRFKPMSGEEDASGGIVFRFSDARYYVIRANALESNFRLYHCDGRRHQLASMRVRPPTLGQWRTIRVVAVGDHIQGYLDGRLLLDHHDGRYRIGSVGLWTKADSVTAFEELTIRGITGGG